jgi:DNA-binding helix-hairpin-helix protein with protein kinase domain
MSKSSQTFICTNTKKTIILTEQIASSGEGEVWKTNQPGYLAKIYHEINQDKIDKLQVMVTHPPHDPNSKKNHISFAWPLSLLEDQSGKIEGFLMPEIRGAKELIDVYNPRRRKALGLEIDWRFLHVTAMNISSIIAAIHHEGYVLGDIKPQNILVNNRALPSIIDTDSFQVKDPHHGKIYRCPVGSEGFTPPELLSKDLATVDQSEIQDRFRLGVIIYYLLFGEHPFGGKWIGSGDSPELTELIRRGIWLYSNDNLLEEIPRTIPIDIVHSYVKTCFLQCFNEGHKHNNLRPSAENWYQVLKIACDDLSQCSKSDKHYYNGNYGKCYWCERAKKLGIDIFPGKQRVNISSVKATFPKFKKQTKSSTSPSVIPSPSTKSPFVVQQKSKTSPLTKPRINLLKWGLGSATAIFALITISYLLQNFTKKPTVPNLGLSERSEEIKCKNEVNKGSILNETRQLTDPKNPTEITDPTELRYLQRYLWKTIDKAWQN